MKNRISAPAEILELKKKNFGTKDKNTQKEFLSFLESKRKLLDLMPIPHHILGYSNQKHFDPQNSFKYKVDSILSVIEQFVLSEFAHNSQYTYCNMCQYSITNLCIRINDEKTPICDDCFKGGKINFIRRGVPPVLLPFLIEE